MNKYNCMHWTRMTAKRPLYFSILFIALAVCSHAQLSGKKRAPRRHLARHTHPIPHKPFSSSITHTVSPSPHSSTYIWEQSASQSFSELIFSWNAIRPQRGRLSFFVSVKHHHWSEWQKMAEWGTKIQKTFSNSKNRFVHPKHVRVEMQHGRLGNAFRIKVVAERGASLKNVKRLFACQANFNLFTVRRPTRPLRSVAIIGIPRQSQFNLEHDRAKDLCSPTSTAMVTRYFANKLNAPKTTKSLHDSTVWLANRVHDKGPVDMYGNWLFNVAQAYQASQGTVSYHVERLQSFEHLHSYLQRKLPVAVSIRGSLRGCAWPYNNGHFVVVMGWDNKRKRVLCLDPAFKDTKKMLRRYRLNDFLNAWGKSKNLSYVAVPHQQLTPLS